ncbi:hypothetical protein Q3G72_006060 [Acer saccharum]|nr:hypothetical protein Q3G72_006060 [Acer saccharum]
MKEYSRDQHYNKYQQRSGGCCRVYFCCSDCRFNVSSSEEADQSSNSDRFASISSLAHTMVQERLDQMIRRQRQQQDQARLHRDRSLRKQIRDHDHHQGTRFIVMVALEKCSHDPREDFKESMIEMIRANRIEEVKNLHSLFFFFFLTAESEYINKLDKTGSKTRMRK